MPFLLPLTHSLTHSLTHALTHSLTHSLCSGGQGGSARGGLCSHRRHRRPASLGSRPPEASAAPSLLANYNAPSAKRAWVRARMRLGGGPRGERRCNTHSLTHSLTHSVEARTCRTRSQVFSLWHAFKVRGVMEQHEAVV